MDQEHAPAVASERPRERLVARGPEALSAVELLALVIGTGTPRESALDLAAALLAEAGDVARLAALDVPRLARRHGLGVAKAARIVAALELGRRVASATPTPRPRIATAAAAARLVGPELAAATEERMLALLLDRRLRLVRVVTLYRGTVDGLAIRPDEVFRAAVEARAHAVVLAHNHPSGDVTPSDADVETTRRLARAGAILGVALREHVVITRSAWAAIRAGKRGRWASPSAPPRAPRGELPDDHA